MNNPKSIAVYDKTGHIYIANMNDHRLQVFTCNGEYLFMFNENMSQPRSIFVTHNKVLVSQYSGHSINMYELEGKLIKSVGSRGSREAQFSCPFGLNVSETTNNIYVCDYNNNRVQIFTEYLKFHSILEIVVFNHQHDVKITRVRVWVLDKSDSVQTPFNQQTDNSWF